MPRATVIAGTAEIPLVESFAYGWYIALVFGPIYNICVSWGHLRRSVINGGA